MVAMANELKLKGCESALRKALEEINVIKWETAMIGFFCGVLCGIIMTVI